MKFFLAFFILIASTTYAQDAGSVSKLAWDQDAVTLVEAQGFTYKYYADSAVIGVTLTSVTCVGTVSPFQCQVAFPAFTPGTHTLALTSGNFAGESPKSTPTLNFTFVVIPTSPKNLTIK